MNNINKILSELLTRDEMIINIKYAIRILKRNPLLLYISVPGLAVGLCAILLLVVYLNFELSFDKHFPTCDRVLRLCNTEGEEKSRTLSISLRTAYTQLPARVPEIEKAVQTYPGWVTKVETDKASFSDLNLIYADPEFFDVFGLKLLQGNINEALSAKSNIVLTKSTAEKLFGPGNSIGKSFKLDKLTVIVSGVMNDLPKTTHFKFDMLMPLESNSFITSQGSLEFRTYYLIKKGAGIEKARQNIAAANEYGKEGDRLIKAKQKPLRNCFAIYTCIPKHRTTWFREQTLLNCISLLVLPYLSF